VTSANHEREPQALRTTDSAADLHRVYKLATADAIVYATARRTGAELRTCDLHFRGLPDVALYPKRGAQLLAAAA